MKSVEFDEYLNCLEWHPIGPLDLTQENSDENRDNYVFWNKNYRMYLQEVDKLALNAIDDKRKYLNNI